MQRFEDKAGKPIPGPFRIVDSGELLNFTVQGWGLVFTFVEEVVEWKARFVPRVATDHRPGYNNTESVYAPDGSTVRVPFGSDCIFEPVVLKKQRFVLQQGTEPALAAFMERAEQAEERAEQAEHAQGLAEQKLASEQARAETLERNSVEWQRQSVASSADRHQLRERGDKLERAIGKLRQELGEAKMREVLGE